jgi:hypothetical protein
VLGANFDYCIMTFKQVKCTGRAGYFDVGLRKIETVYREAMNVY